MSEDEWLGYATKTGFVHDDGKRCWRTDQGRWVRDGEGTYSDAECRLEHGGAESTDPVSLPPHYQHLPVECIDVAEHFSFCLGNVIKYVWRHQHKGKPLEDLRKARYYLDRAIAKMENDIQNTEDK